MICFARCCICRTLLMYYNAAFFIKYFPVHLPHEQLLQKRKLYCISLKKFYVHILRTVFHSLLHFLYTFVTISLIKSLKTVKLIINLQRTTVLFMLIYNRSHSLENATCSIVFVILLRMFWQLYLCKPVMDRHQTLFFNYRSDVDSPNYIILMLCRTDGKKYASLGTIGTLFKINVQVCSKFSGCRQ